MITTVFGRIWWNPRTFSSHDPNHKIYFIISESLLSPKVQSRAYLKSVRNNCPLMTAECHKCSNRLWMCLGAKRERVIPPEGIRSGFLRAHKCMTSWKTADWRLCLMKGDGWVKGHTREPGAHSRTAGHSIWLKRRTLWNCMDCSTPGLPVHR